MANKVQELSELLADLEYDFGVRDSAIHMLAVLQDFWEADIPVRTTDLLNNFTHTSRATTHRMLQELLLRRSLKFLPIHFHPRARGYFFCAWVEKITPCPVLEG